MQGSLYRDDGRLQLSLLGPIDGGRAALGSSWQAGAVIRPPHLLQADLYQGSRVGSAAAASRSGQSCCRGEPESSTGCTG